jgi:hypothetical protein
MDEAMHAIELETLLLEIHRYLAAVDAFRDADCEPRWTREPRLVPIPSTESDR